MPLMWPRQSETVALQPRRTGVAPRRAGYVATVAHAEDQGSALAEAVGAFQAAGLLALLTDYLAWSGGGLLALHSPLRVHCL
jgi:hypothetical protein